MIMQKGFFPMKLLYLINDGINKLILSKQLRSVVNPIAQQIVFYSDIYNKPALLILAISCLRFSDAQKLLKDFPLLPDKLNFIQAKTKRPITLKFNSIPLVLRLQIKDLSKQIEVFKYGTIRNNISNYNRTFLRNYKLDFNSKAHLFRHLEASYLYTKNTPKEIIKKRLGHIDFSIQSQYIHKELFNLFSQTNL